MDKDVFLTFKGTLRLDMKVFASRALLQIDRSCHLLFTITDAACLSVCYEYPSKPSSHYIMNSN